MIDKPFLEQELKRLQDQYQQSVRITEQLLGAILMAQGLLKKAEDDTGASAPVVVPPATSEV